MSRRIVDPFLKSSLATVGANPGLYGWSSFRRGSATSFFLATRDVETLRVHGDWSSQVYTRYLSIPAKDRVGVVKTLQNLLK